MTISNDGVGGLEGLKGLGALSQTDAQAGAKADA